ncbi:MAG: hypothetical protein AAF992_00420 [Bacteroidota bacterium]
MKKNTILTAILVCVLLACSDDEDPQGPPPSEFGKATLVLNDKPLEFTVSARGWQCNAENLEISLNQSSANLERGTSFFVGNIPAKEGRYTLRRGDTNSGECELDTPFGSALKYNGATLVTLYEIMEDKGPNEFVITRYDSAAQRLEGRFQVALAVEDTLSPFSKREHPDTLRITQGTFVTTISPPEE